MATRNEKTTILKDPMDCIEGIEIAKPGGRQIVLLLRKRIDLSTFRLRYIGGSSACGEIWSHARSHWLPGVSNLRNATSLACCRSEHRRSARTKRKKRRQRQKALLPANLKRMNDMLGEHFCCAAEFARRTIERNLGVRKLRQLMFGADNFQPRRYRVL